MKFDTIIRNGLVVDGSSSAPYRADVGIIGDRIDQIGDLSGADALVEFDATDRVVAPGFVDVHTHLDAQAFWDTTLSPSPLHGVTTAIAGNCGFSISPLSDDPADRDYLMRMLSRVEGMPLESLQQGVPWDWRSTAQYLDALDHTLSINTAFKVGHSALRRYVMGVDATRRTATDKEVSAMCDLLREGIVAGAIGFSSSWSPTHNDTEQNMVPSRYGDRAELLALCGVLAAYPGTSLEFIPTIGVFDDEVSDLLAEMSVAAKSQLNWNALAVTARTLESARAKLAVSDVAASRGGKVVGLTAPMKLDFRMNFASGFLLDALPGWEHTMLLPLDEKREVLADPKERARLAELASDRSSVLSRFARWGEMVIYYVVSPENEQYLGRLIGDIAKEQGKSPFDALCDIALADDLATSFGHPFDDDEPLEDWQARVDIWRDERAVIGASDAGAHLDMFMSGNYPTIVLREAVAKRHLLPIEEAIHLLTAVPADLYGLRDRGRLVPGAYADVIVFDLETIATGPMEMRSDLPAGASRLYADAVGIDHVFCNGVEIVDHGSFTAARPGIVLRSGVHTV